MKLLVSKVWFVLVNLNTIESGTTSSFKDVQGSTIFWFLYLMIMNLVYWKRLSLASSPAHSLLLKISWKTFICHLTYSFSVRVCSSFHVHVSFLKILRHYSVLVQVRVECCSCIRSPGIFHTVAWYNVVANSGYKGITLKYTYAPYTAKFMNAGSGKVRVYIHAEVFCWPSKFIAFIDLFKFALGPVLCNMFHTMKFHPSLLNSRNAS